MFVEAAIVIGSSDTCEDQLLALRCNAIEIDQRPDHGDQQGQGDKPESDQNQSI